MAFAQGNFAAKVNATEPETGLGMVRSLALRAAMAVGMIFGVAVTADRSEAMGFCNCCDSQLTQSCSKVCTAISLKPGMCPAVVDYGGRGSASKGANPLNGMSLRDMTLGEASPWQLELFRRFMEKGRRHAVASYKKAMRQLGRHKLTKADFESADALYREALVNYYHGIRAYLTRVGTKSD
jgi:hypothetical protein